MKCEIRSGVCWGFATTFVYRYGGRYESCAPCREAIEMMLREKALSFLKKKEIDTRLRLADIYARPGGPALELAIPDISTCEHVRYAE